MMTRSLLAASTALALFLPAAAFADCAPNAPAVNGTVTCTATDTNGFNSAVAGITVNVDPTATVTNTGDAIRVDGANVTVNNSGTLNGGDEGIDVRGTGTTVTNALNASIVGTDRGIDADTRNNLTVTNDGTITGTNSDAIRLNNNGTITNTGTIQGGDEGIQATANLSFTNHGTLNAADEGIEATDNATILNTGTITAVDDAIQTDDYTSITNSGLIESTQNDALDIDTGSVINTGTIRATVGGEDGIDFDPQADLTVISTVDNRAGALIEGVIGINTDPANDARQAITNAGTIIGRSGTALFLEDGDDSLKLFATGVIKGTTDFGAGDDMLTLVGKHGLAIGGGDLFDGGIGNDTLTFDPSVLASDLIGTRTANNLAGALRLIFANDDGTRSAIKVINFENFAFGDRTLALSDLPTPVPVPASLLLLAGGLGTLTFLRRKRG